MKYDVFISYRREGGDTLAQLLYDRLTHRGYRVFLDIESLNAGKFNEKLLDVIEECKDIVVVLPPNALDRCHNEGDWLYREIEHSIKLSKNIVPVMMKGFVWPEDIPEEIAEIQNYNGILDNKDYFDAVIDKITTLLTSRPVIGGNFTRNLQRKKGSFKEKVKRRRKFLIIGALLLLCLAGICGFLYYQKNQKQLKAESYVSIMLTPAEDMTAADYSSAIEILEERIRLLAGDQEYSFTAETDSIAIEIPMDVFHEIDISNVLRSYISRPAEIYLASTDIAAEEEGFHIERSSVESFEKVSEIPVTFDMDTITLHGIEDPADCQYFVLSLTDEAAADLKSWIAEQDTNAYYLCQDLEEMGIENVCYFYAIEEDNTIYVCDNYQYDNFLNLLEYNYTHETFSQALTFNIQLPVRWESIDDTEYFVGANQCNVEDLSGQLMRIDLSTANTEFTEGEYRDTIRILKTRLDALGTPYSFGYLSNDPNTVSFKIAPDRLNDQIIDLITTTNSLHIKSNFHQVLYYYYIEDIEILQKEDGSYYMQITPTASWHTYEEQNIIGEEQNIQELDQNELVSLCHNNYPSVPFDQATLSETYDGEVFIFDSLSVYGLDSVDEEHKYIFDLLKTVAMDDTLPYSYSFANVYRENIDDDEEVLLTKEIISDEIQTLYEDQLSQIPVITSYDLTVEDMAQNILLRIYLPEDENFAANAHDVFKKLYQNCEIASGDEAQIIIYSHSDTNDMNYIYTSTTTDLFEHCTDFYAYYSTTLSENSIEQYEQIFNSDPFYQQVHVDDYHKTEDGTVTFK